MRKLHKIERELGYLCFLDKGGDISRVPANRGESTGKKNPEKETKKAKEINDIAMDFVR